MDKKYDWLAVLQYQPDYTLSDFKELGVTPENTEFRSKDYYKGLLAVREADLFKGVDGNFDEKKFDKFYDEASLLYNGYANEEVYNTLDKIHKYDPWEWWNSDPSKVMDVQPKMTLGENPLMTTIGIKGLGIATESPFSIRELAQRQPYYDVVTGEWSDKTPNDYAGVFKSWTAPTLVLATYDEDTPEIDENGREIMHHAGEIKLKDGLPYYETLGNRDSSNKDFLLREDILSVDGSKWNKYDFFDADGKKTDPGKIALKTIARVVPYLIPWGVGQYYAAIKAVQGMAEFLPVFFKSVDGVFTNDIMGNEFGRTMNDVAGFMRRLDHGVSDNSREHLVTWENAGKMFADITGQLFEQKSAQRLTKLFKDPAIRNNANLSKALSYLYMSTTSSTEAYDIFKRAGANDRTTGLALWGLIGIYYKLMDADYYKHALFRNTPIDEKSIKEPTNRLVKMYQDAIALDPAALRTDTPENALKTMNWFQRNWEKLLKIPSKLENNGVIRGKTMFSSALSEGVEEVMEEVGIDALKGLSKGMEALGFNVAEPNKTLDFGYSAEDVLTRYGMSLAGGFFGGAVFHGYNSFDPEYKAYKKALQNNEYTIGDIVTLIIQGRQNEIYEEIARRLENKEYGSNDLSATKFNIVRDVNGESVAFEGANGNMSQNETVYNEVFKTIKFIENVLKEENFTKALQKVKDITKLNDEQAGRLLFTGQSLINFNAENLILDDLKKLGTKIVEVTTKMRAIEDANRPTDQAGGETKLKEILAGDANYQELVKDLEELRLQRDAIYNKENIAKYMEQAAIALNEDVLKTLLGFSDVNSYAIARYTKPLSKFTAKEQEKIKKEFNDYFDGTNIQIFETAYIYNVLSQKFRDKLLEKEALLSKVDPDETVRVETVGQDFFKKLETISRLNNSIKQLEEKEESTEEDEQKLKEYQEQKTKLTEEVNGIISDPQKLISRLHIGEFDDVELFDFERALVNWYHALEGKQKYDDVDYTRFLNRIKALYSIDLIKRGFEQMIADRRQSVGANFEEGHELELGFDEKNPNDFLWANPWETDIQIQFIDLVKEFYDNLGVNNQQAVETYKKIRSLLKDRAKYDDIVIDGLLGESLTEVIDDGSGNTVRNEFGISIIPKLNDKFLPDVIEEIEESRKKITYSDATSLIKDFLMMLDDTTLMPLVDLLQREEARLTDVANYTIGNVVYRNQLKTLRSIVNAMTGIISGAYDGMNKFLNTYRKHEKLDEYAVISENTARILKNDLDNIKNRINFILKLDERNSGLKLREQKDVGANMRVKFLDKLTNHVYVEEFEKEFDINLDKIISENTAPDFSLQDVTTQNYDKYEKDIIAVETAIYNEIKKKGFSEQEIVNKLIKIYGDDNLYKLQSTKLTKEKSEVITDYDTIMYAFSLMTLNSNDFFVLYRDALKKAKEINPDFSIVPVFGQEYALRLIYSYAKNKVGFNYLLEQIATTYKGNDEYQIKKRILYNMMNVFGGAGTGKTRGVAAILKYIFPDAEFRLLGPTDTQVNTLLEVFGEVKDSSNGMTIDEFKEKAFPGIDSADNLEYNSTTKVITVKEDTSKPYGWFSVEDGLKFMVVDEIAMNNSVILKALSDYAVANDALLIGLGDPKQNTGKITFKLNNNLTTQSDSFEDTVHLKSPYLVANFRAAYRSKADNYIELLNLISSVDDAIEKEGGNKTRTDYNDELSNVIGGNKIKLKYYATREGIAGDLITNDEKRFKTLLDTLLEKDGIRILLVTDSTTDSKYVDDKYDKIKRQHVDKAQGGEYDYVFVDRALDVDAMIRDKYNAVKDIYTISQRSTLGSIILDVNDGYNKKLDIVSSLDPSSIAPWEMTGAQKMEFNTWRMNALKDLNPSENYNENVAIATSKLGEENPVKSEPESESEETPEVKQEEEETPNLEEKEEEETTKPLDVKEEIEEKSTEEEKPAKPINPAIPSVEPPKVNITTESTETINLESWIEDVTSTFDDDYENNHSNEDKFGEGVFRVDEFFNVLFTSDFYNSEKVKDNSAYNVLKTKGLKLSEKDYQNFVLWASRKILLNNFDFNNLLGLTIKDSAKAKRIFKDFSLSFIRTVREGEKSVLYAVFSNKTGDVKFEIPVAYTPIMKNGIINIEGTKPFEIRGTIEYDHSNGEVITLRELFKRYPWLNFSDFAGTVINAEFEGNDEKTENARAWIKRNLGKTLITAFGLVPHDKKTLFQTGTHPNGDIWIGQDPINTRKFAIQRIVENYDNIFLYAAAINYLSSVFSDKDSEEYLRKHGWIIDKTDIAKTITDHLYELTGNPDWQLKILRTNINNVTKDKDKRRELWSSYFKALKDADQGSSLISWAQNERILADLFGNMLKINGNKNLWLKLHGKFHKLNDRSFGLVIKLDPIHQYIIYTDSQTERPGKIYVSEFNANTYRPTKVIKEFDTRGNPETFENEFKNAINVLLNLTSTKLTLDDFNSSRIRISSADISWNGDGTIKEIWVSDSIRNWFNIFNPNNLAPLEELLDSEQYKHKLYGNIPISGKISGSKLMRSEILDSYVTRAVKWRGEHVYISPGKIIPETSSNPAQTAAIQADGTHLINHLVEYAKKLIPSEKVKELKNYYLGILEQNMNIQDYDLDAIINSFMKDINTYLLNNATTESVSQIQLSDNGLDFVINSKSAIEYAYPNLIKEAYGEELTELNIIKLPLSGINIVTGNPDEAGNPIHYVFFKEDGKLKILKTKTYNQWVNLNNAVKELNEFMAVPNVEDEYDPITGKQLNIDPFKQTRSELNVISGSYFKHLLTNSVLDNDVVQYWRIISSFKSKQALAEYADKIQETLEQYLISRIENDEC